MLVWSSHANSHAQESAMHDKKLQKLLAVLYDHTMQGTLAHPDAVLFTDDASDPVIQPNYQRPERQNPIGPPLTTSIPEPPEPPDDSPCAR